MAAGGIAVGVVELDPHAATSAATARSPRIRGDRHPLRSKAKRARFMFGTCGRRLRVSSHRELVPPATVVILSDETRTFDLGDLITHIRVENPVEAEIASRLSVRDLSESSANSCESLDSDCRKASFQSSGLRRQRWPPSQRWCGCAPTLGDPALNPAPTQGSFRTPSDGGIRSEPQSIDGPRTASPNNAPAPPNRKAERCGSLVGSRKPCGVTG